MVHSFDRDRYIRQHGCYGPGFDRYPDGGLEPANATRGTVVRRSELSIMYAAAAAIEAASGSPDRVIVAEHQDAQTTHFGDPLPDYLVRVTIGGEAEGHTEIRNLTLFWQTFHDLLQLDSVATPDQMFI
jgi:hypothetical protein